MTAKGLVEVKVELVARQEALSELVLPDPSLGEDGHRESKRIVRVGVEILIIVAYVGGLHGSHGAGTYGLLGIVSEGDGIRVLQVGDEGSLELLHHVPYDRALNRKILLCLVLAVGT